MPLNQVPAERFPRDKLERRVIGSTAHWRPFDPHPLLPSIVSGGPVSQKPFGL